MAKNLPAIRAIVRQKLRDEFAVGKDQEWQDDELDILIGDCLAEISEHSPYELKETLTTTAGSRILDISSIDDLLYVDEVEYPIGSFPENMRNCSRFGDILTIETDLSPAADESVYLYCHKLHQLTGAISTLKPQLERVLVLGVTGQAAINKARSLIGKVTHSGTRSPADMQTWGMAQLALYRAALPGITKLRTQNEYPRD